MANYLEGGEAQAHVRRIIDELKQADVTLDNYKKWVAKVLDSNSIILTQTESLVMQFTNNLNDLKNKEKRDEFNRNLDDGYVHREVYDILKKMVGLAYEINSWKSIQTEIQQIIFMKLKDVMDDANAFTIKREALQEMRELEEKRNEVVLNVVSQATSLAKEAVENKLEVIDDKVRAFQRIVTENMRQERNDFMDLIKRILEAKLTEKGMRLEVTTRTKPMTEEEYDRSIINRRVEPLKSVEKEEEEVIERAKKKPSRKYEEEDEDNEDDVESTGNNDDIFNRYRGKR